jgi:hypothetical protein
MRSDQLPNSKLSNKRLIKEMGFNRRSNAQHRREVRDFNAQFREEFLASHGVKSWSEVPGFEESIVNLINVQGYCMSDVADMLGLSRQRIEQLIINNDIPITDMWGTQFRVWDDENNRFVSVDPDTFADVALSYYREKHECKYLEILDARYELAAWVCRGLEQTLGRPPAITELCMGIMFFTTSMDRFSLPTTYSQHQKALGYVGGYLVYTTMHNGSFTSCMNEVYARAGVERVDYRRTSRSGGVTGLTRE